MKKTLEQHLAENPVSDNPSSSVFLGGSCNPTVWRFEETIPILDTAGITYFNPQVPEWDDKYVALEEAAKKECKKLLFVIDGQTRAIYSCLEILDFAHKRPSDLYVVIDSINDGTEIAGQIVTGRELKDITAARKMLRSMLQNLGVKIFLTAEEATKAIISDLRSGNATKFLTPALS